MISVVDFSPFLWGEGGCDSIIMWGSVYVCQDCFTVLNQSSDFEKFHYECAECRLTVGYRFWRNIMLPLCDYKYKDRGRILIRNVGTHQSGHTDRNMKQSII
jgi:hypothetical protein